MSRSDGSTQPAVDDEVLLARAYLSRVAEPTCLPLWRAALRYGPVATAAAIRDGTADAKVLAACGTRATQVDPEADLATADRYGIRLVVPESPDWPHFAIACLEAAGRRRLTAWEAGDTKVAAGGEPIPPLALWVRGPIELPTLAVRTVGIVGSRSATHYGEQVAAELSYALASRDVDVVSGGAYGIDAAAHRGAIAATGKTIIVSAGGAERPYPSSNARLFERAADAGLIISESPPGSAPRRSRFLSRNRLIAAFSTGTVVVEAALRSGAKNTAHHCLTLGRPIRAVPGPVTSAMSAGCHALLRDDVDRAILVTGWQDVIEVVGGVSDMMPDPAPAARSAADAATMLRSRLDVLDSTARQLFDSLPAARAVSVDRLAVLSGLPPRTVIRTLPGLELSGLAESQDGMFRVGKLVRAASRISANARSARSSTDSQVAEFA